MTKDPHAKLYSEVIHKTRYARWDETSKRREDLPETFDRYLNYFTHFLHARGATLKANEFAEIHDAMHAMEIMPSMRALMTAGKALDSAPVAAYNCAYLPIDSIASFAETAFILMCGTGVGFSVERMNVEKLPVIPYAIDASFDPIVVEDSREGWCVAIAEYITSLYAGVSRPTDTSGVRPAGARLKTFGGFSSGPEPLNELFEHIRLIFDYARGRQLTPYETFSIICFIAQVIVVGGVRRSATICLFDRDDFQMLYAKHGDWWRANPHFAMANISAVFEEAPAWSEFEKAWTALKNSGSGEPGFFNRAGARRQCEAIGRAIYMTDGSLIQFGINPCGEIILRPYQFCNLSAFVLRRGDDLSTVLTRVAHATTLGTWQSAIDEFPFLRQIWADNTKAERLLGVCPLGIMDHEVTQKVDDETARWLNALQRHAIATNARVADDLGIERSASVTSVKPAGNSSQLYGAGSGIHPWYSPYYIRTIRQSRNAPITQFLIDNGIPHEVSVQNERDMVFSFPVKAPEGALCASDLSALDQLEHWLMVRQNYTTHTVSCTVYVRPHEWDEVGKWVFDHFDDVIGISFLPYDEHTYQQAVYTPISESEYNDAIAAMPSSIDWDLLRFYEDHDETSVSQEFACTGGVCEIGDA